jgi:hypothetical protein
MMAWIIFEKLKERPMGGPHAMEKAWSDSGEQRAENAEEGSWRGRISARGPQVDPGRTARAVVNRPFKKSQVHRGRMTLVREAPTASVGTAQTTVGASPLANAHQATRSTD